MSLGVELYPLVLLIAFVGSVQSVNASWTLFVRWSEKRCDARSGALFAVGYACVCALRPLDEKE